MNPAFKKVLHVIRLVITWIFVVAAVAMMVFTIISSTTFDRTDRDIFGYKAFIVLSDSMKATDFDAGDLVFVKETDPATLKQGDIISYISQNTDNYGETVTHKIRSLTEDAEGNPGFITYGTTTDVDDETVVTYEFVLGKYSGTKIVGAGHFFHFLKSTQGYIICILVPFVILILIQIISSFRLFVKYKREQNAKLDEERKKLSEERAESQRMMEELAVLKAQMTGSVAPAAAAPADNTAEPAVADNAPAAATAAEPSPNAD